MIVTEELSEILGMFAADGNLQDDHISLWGSIYEDREYYDNVVCPLFSKVFDIEVKAHEKKSNSVYGFYICNKKVIAIFKEFGFTKRKTYTVKIPKEIILSKNKKILAAFVRGFTDCDGCLNFMKRYEKGYCEFKRKYHTYPRICIRIVSENMINDLSFILNRLGINHSLYFNKSGQLNARNSWVITVRGNKGVIDWMDKIGLNNPSKNTKFLIWKMHRFCPTPSSISQRELILNGQLNPEVFYNSL